MLGMLIWIALLAIWFNQRMIAKELDNAHDEIQRLHEKIDSLDLDIFG